MMSLSFRMSKECNIAPVEIKIQLIDDFLTCEELSLSSICLKNFQRQKNVRNLSNQLKRREVFIRIKTGESHGLGAETSVKTIPTSFRLIS